MNNWILAMVILPVIVSAFKKELGNILAAWNVYRLRAYAEGSSILLMNSAKGEWEVVHINCYVFSVRARKRGVYITHRDGGSEKITLLNWSTMRKRQYPKEYNAIQCNS